MPTNINKKLRQFSIQRVSWRNCCSTTSNNLQVSISKKRSSTVLVPSSLCKKSLSVSRECLQFLPHLTNSEHTEVKVKVKSITKTQVRVHPKGYPHTFFQAGVIKNCRVRRSHQKKILNKVNFFRNIRLCVHKNYLRWNKVFITKKLNRSCSFLTIHRNFPLHLFLALLGKQG